MHMSFCHFLCGCQRDYQGMGAHGVRMIENPLNEYVRL